MIYKSHENKESHAEFQYKRKEEEMLENVFLLMQRILGHVIAAKTLRFQDNKKE